VAAFLVSCLAYGRVASIKSAADRLLAILGPNPERAIQDPALVRATRGFTYRFQRGDDIPNGLEAVAKVREAFGSLRAAFGAGVRHDDEDYRPAMVRLGGLFRRFLVGSPSRGLQFFLPGTLTTSCQKRFCLYLRWMLRPTGEVDPGTWCRPDALPGHGGVGDIDLGPRRLVIPLDTHVARIASYIGLTDRTALDMQTAVQITRALRCVCPEDPLRYDIVLCHLGISGACRRKLDPEVCADCRLRSVCRYGPAASHLRFSAN
jgi:uncharacterized protein (TIGR02757 family)